MFQKCFEIIWNAFLHEVRSHRIFVMEDFVHVFVALLSLGSFSHWGRRKWPRDFMKTSLFLLSSITIQSLKQKWFRSAMQSSWHNGRPIALPSWSTQSGNAYLQSKLWNNQVSVSNLFAFSIRLEKALKFWNSPQLPIGKAQEGFRSFQSTNFGWFVHWAILQSYLGTHWTTPDRDLGEIFDTPSHCMERNSLENNLFENENHLKSKQLGSEIRKNKTMKPMSHGPLPDST